MTSRREAGEGRLGFIVWAVIVIVIGLVLFQAVPVRIKMAEFEDFLVEVTRGARPQTTEASIRKGILDKAKELELPLDAKNLTVQKTRGSIKLRAEYTVLLEFPFYTWEWNKVHDVDRPIFDV